VVLQNGNGSKCLFRKKETPKLLAAAISMHTGCNLQQALELQKLNDSTSFIKIRKNIA
jgi:hypothetical protein